MNVLVLLGHPTPESFNHAMAHTVVGELAAGGHVVAFHDLYAEGFDPVLTGAEIPRDADLPPSVARHCAELAAADGIVIVHPNWWGMPPAVLKGWVDRVVRPGTAYEFEETDSGEGVPVGLLKARRVLVLNTGNTPILRELDVFGDPLQGLWKDCVFGLCGVREFHRRYFTVVCTSDDAKRRSWLEEARQLARDLFPPD